MQDKNGQVVDNAHSRRAMEMFGVSDVAEVTPAQYHAAKTSLYAYGPMSMNLPRLTKEDAERMMRDYMEKSRRNSQFIETFTGRHMNPDLVRLQSQGRATRFSERSPEILEYSPGRFSSRNYLVQSEAAERVLREMDFGDIERRIVSHLPEGVLAVMMNGDGSATVITDKPKQEPAPKFRRVLNLED